VSYGSRGSWGSGPAAVRGYIDQALDKMGITNPQARANWERGMLTIASRESAYNSPQYQVNLWDSNANGPRQADGAPLNSSRGAFQTIPPTFAAHHQPGTSTDIYDPVANAAAAMNYIMANYGVSRDGGNLQSNVQQADPNRPPRGY
jgi:SLT domain-containing protein